MVIKNSLKVLSFNIHKGFGPGNWRFTLKEIKDFIAKEKAHIVFLQEAVGLHTGDKVVNPHHINNNQVEYLAEGLYPFHIYGGNKFHAIGHHGNAILSQIPLKLVKNHNISQNAWERRGFLHCISQCPFAAEIPLHLLNTHLNLLERDRKKQIQWIKNYLVHEIPAGEPLILAGDFNDWQRKALRYLLRKTPVKEAFYENFNGATPNSFPSFLPRLSLDRIFYNNFVVENAVIYRDKSVRYLSDHVPLSVVFHPL